MMKIIFILSFLFLFVVNLPIKAQTNINILTTRDAVTHYSDPDQNYNSFGLRVTRSDELDVYSASFVYFDLSDIPSNVTIINAYLRLYNYNKDLDSSKKIRIERAASNWNETSITWNNMPLGTTPPNAKFYTINENAFNLYSVTEFIEGWYLNTYPNYGFQLFIEAEGSAHFRDREYGNSTSPMLQVLYAYPEIEISKTSITFEDVYVGECSNSQSYQVSGTYLKNDLWITAPNHYKISFNNSDWYDILNIEPDNEGSLNHTIYVRFCPNSSGTKSDNISHTSSGATNENLNLSGISITKPQPSLNFIVEYENFPSDAQAAVQYAIDIWGTLISSDVPIRVTAKWNSLNGVLAYGSPSSFIKDPEKDVMYPIAIAEKISNTPLNEDNEPDITLDINSNISWYFGLDGETPSNKYDLVTSTLHELTHGIGFFSSFTVDNSGLGSYGLPYPLIYDTFIENGTGQQLINTSLFANPSVELASQLESNDIFWNGQEAIVQNSGNRPKLYAPTTWSGGSSIVHIDNTVSLMSYGSYPGVSKHDPGPIILGMLSDMGWNENDAPTEEPSLSVSPTSLNFGDIQKGTNSDPQNYSITGSNLTDDVEINAPEGFPISFSSGSGYADELNISPSDGSVDKTIYVRFSPNEEKTYEDEISNSSSGASIKIVYVKGNATTLPIGEDSWVALSNYGVIGRSNTVGFSIGEKGYVGTGYPNMASEFWEYNPLNNSWTQKADFGGGNRDRAAGFSIGSKGYLGIGIGLGTNSTTYKNDFWEYDPQTNTWTEKAEFPGSARGDAVGFSIGGKGYIGTGKYGASTYKNDFWEYDPQTNTWTEKAEFPGSARGYAVGFSIGDIGYIGTGRREPDGGNLKDFWEYNPQTDTWTQKTDFGGSARGDAVGFSIGNKGYIATGYSNGSNKYDIWEYNPDTDSWTQKKDFIGAGRRAATAFSIENYGYLGTGMYYDGGWVFFQDFFRYDPSADVPIPGIVTLISPSNGSLNISTDTTLTWTASNEADTYQVQVSTDSTFSPTHIDTSGIAATELSVYSLVNNTEYFWKVSAESSAGVSDWSEVYSFTTMFETSIEEEESIPFRYALHQNYPNPFNPATNIRYGIPEASDVKLEVYNMLGQRVAVLVNERKNAGWHQVVFNAQNLSSGMYTYRIEAGEFVKTQKLMLIK